MKRKTLAIPIRTTDYSDSSQIASLFTREAGLVEVIAKGAYRSKNAFQGSLDLAVLREVVYAERRPPGLSILAESSVRDGYRGLRTSWDRHVAASHVLELLRVVATGGESASDLFDLTAATLAHFSEAPAPELTRGLLHFQLRALRVLGFLGTVDRCVACGRRWPGERRPAWFSPRSGGIVCRTCRRGVPPCPGATLPGPVVKTLGQLAETPRVGAGGALERAVLRELHGLLTDGCTFFLERPIRMLKYDTVRC